MAERRPSPLNPEQVSYKKKKKKSLGVELKLSEVFAYAGWRLFLGSILLQFVGLMWKITIAGDNSWMIQLAPNWVVTVSLQREKPADLDPDWYRSPRVPRKVPRTLTTPQWLCQLLNTGLTPADPAPRIKTPQISRFLGVLSETKSRPWSSRGRQKVTVRLWYGKKEEEKKNKKLDSWPLVELLIF